MNIIIHYETEEGPKNYSVSAMTREDLERAVKSFKDRTGLNDTQFTIEMISTSI